jgi:predicted  nucleic acid-binding Zn-ribbon protein
MDRDIAKRGEAIKTAEAEIEALTKQIEEKAKFIQATNVEMNKAQADLTMKESSFNTAISSATEKIKSDIVKIKTHLSK